MVRGQKSYKLNLTHSLQWRLLIILTLVMVLFSLLFTSFSFWQSYRQAQKLQDSKLSSLVSLAKSHDLTVNEDEVDVDLDYNQPHRSSVNININNLQEDLLVSNTIIFWLNDTRLQEYFTPAVLKQLQQKPDGLYDIQGISGKWRVYLDSESAENDAKYNAKAAKTVRKQRLIVAELANIRHQLAWQSAQQVLFPILLLLPILMVSIVVTINRLFRPLNQLTHRFADNSQASNDLAGLLALAENTQLNQANLPAEIKPFVEVISQQMQALVNAVSVNQRFVANAAHQLRTPMTAILLQAEQLKHLSPQATDYQQQIDELLISIKRNNQLMNQLLLLAKSEQVNPAHKPLQHFSTQEALTQILVNCYPIAAQKNITLEVTELIDVALIISELNFNIIAQNLIDNAIKYTPNDGQVTIALYSQQEQAILKITDSGVGIEENELRNITEPFYRAYSADMTHTNEGFGLGLSIVKNLVENSAGKLIIENCYQPVSSHATDIAAEHNTFNAVLDTSAHANANHPTICGLCVTVIWQQAR